MNKRVVLTGPESTGKSAITGYLADRYRLPYAMEYARIYLEKHGPSYDYELLLRLSFEHKAHQLVNVPESLLLGVFDTDLINYKIWCEVAFGQCHPEILAGIELENDHVYLLCYPDLPWEFDPLREHRDDRMMLFERHREELERLNRPYLVIEGLGTARYINAESAFRQLTGVEKS